MTPARNKNTLWVWLMVTAIAGLTLSFAMHWWGSERVSDETVLVDPAFYAGLPLRQPKLEAILVRGGVTYRCNVCHQHLTPSQVPKSAVPAHPEITLNHGDNTYCTTCHMRVDREKLVDIKGEALSFAQSHLICLACHGPVYRDWEKGVHGRMNDVWDQKGEGRKLTCVACHDPHDSAFKPMVPSPAPPQSRGGGVLTPMAKDMAHAMIPGDRIVLPLKSFVGSHR